VAAERWRRIREVFEAVLEGPADRRETRLDELCDGDDDLRREVESLLDASTMPATPSRS
jgi:hypothetical protein